MKFGGMVATKIDDWEIFPFLEDLGYNSGWAPDSQMIWSDCYATLALAAHHTSRIRLGTGVAIAGTRTAPVTAHSIASINKLAPGRTFLAMGTGHTAMRVMGQNPIKIDDFQDHLRVISGLLRGEEVSYAPGSAAGQTAQPIKFLDRQLDCLNLDDPIPLYVAANGPRALAATGTYGDGRISAGNEPDKMFARNLGRIHDAARDAGRTLPDDFHTSCLTYASVLDPGDKLTDDRVIEEVGGQVVSSLHFYYELYQLQGSEHFIPEAIKDVWADYKAHVENHMPPERRHQFLHQGHCSFVTEDERKFVTPTMIRTTLGLVGTRGEIIERVHQMEANGMKEIVLLPDFSRRRDVFADFAREVMANC
jgi:hypothetical protein